MEQHVQRLTIAQRADGHEVLLLFNFGAAQAPGDIRICGALPIYRIRPQCIRDALFYLLVAAHLIRRRVRPDILHLHGDWSAFLLGRALAIAIRAKSKVASIHDHLRDGAAWRMIYRRSLTNYDLCFCTGRQESVLLSTLLGRSVQWITSGVHEHYFAARVDESKSDILTVAHLTKRKGLGLVLRIAALLPQYSFRIVGDGPEMDGLVRDAKDMGVRNVKFVGHLGLEGVADELRSGKVFLLTSMREGTPTALLEAMACGLPVVTSLSNDYADILTAGVNGYVVESDEPADFATRLECLLVNPELRQSMGDANRLKAREFAWPVVNARITEAMRVALLGES